MFKNLLYIFIISMIPVVELRGAIPVAIGLGVPTTLAYIVCIIGNILPLPFIFFFARKVLMWGQNKPLIGKPFSWVLKKGGRCGEKMKRKKNIYIALLFFVGVPLPGTGLWTGTLASSILDLDFKKSFIAISAGVLLAGIIMSVVSSGVFNLLISI